MRRAIFLDRDGIIIQPILGEAPTEVSRLKLIPGIIPVIKKAKKLGNLIFVVSNQPDIALGLIDEETKNKMEKKFVKLLKKEGIVMDKIFYCHHDPKGKNPKYSFDCQCRKPKPGMLISAKNEFNIDMEKSFMVGDRASDIKAGQLANTKTILYDPQNLQQDYLSEHKVKPDYKVSSLQDILQIISEKVAFILAAGEGKRMLTLTRNTPKPLLKINNKPMIEYILNLLMFHGFSKIGVNIFYKAQKIEGYLEKINVKIVKEKKLSGTAGGVLAISKKLKPDLPFLVVSSDMMVNFNLSKVYKFHLKHKGIATVCCYFRTKSKLNAKKSGLVLFDRKTKKITRFDERPEKITSQWVNSSVYVFNPEVIEIIRSLSKKHLDIASDLMPILLKKKNLYAYPVNHKQFYQLGVDSQERIKQVEEDLISGKFTPLG